MQQTRPAVVLTDLRLPQGDGFGVLRAAKELDSELPVVVMTAYGSIQDAVAAMKEGAMDFLAKPVDPDHLLLLVERALAQRRLVTENMLLKDELAMRRGAPQIIGEAPALKQVIVALQRAAGTDATVLLEGESGTGKELFARALHALSDRSDGPFVAINCAAIPDNLLETELFGHEKGAFTGATDRHTGKFVEASGGTLFLDEISELPLAAQVKLLRALQEGAVEAVGGRKPVKVDVRIISATNRKLLDRVKSGHFREDLFYRLHVLPLTIPPLRMRREDIPHLLRHFLARFCAEENRPITGISGEAMAHLSQLEWPGNIRQLENAVYRAVVMSDHDQLGLEDFLQVAGQSAATPTNSEHSEPLIVAPAFHSTVPAMISGSDIPIVPQPSAGTLVMLTNAGEIRALEELESEIIRFAISHYRGQMSEVARRLKIGRSTLYRKLDEGAAAGDPSAGGAADVR